MPESNAAVVWRLQALETITRDLRTEKADAKDVAALAEEVRALRRAVVGFALTIGGSAVVFAFGIVAVLG